MVQNQKKVALEVMKKISKSIEVMLLHISKQSVSVL